MWLAALILLLFLACLFAFYQLLGFKQLAPWVPSKTKQLDKALELINLPAGSSFIDLGAGDGRAVFLAAGKYKYQAEGIELAPLIWLFSKMRQVLGRHKVTLSKGNLYDKDISFYDVIYVYGLPENIKIKLWQKLQQAKSGSWLISYNFSLPDKEPQHILADKWRRALIYKL